VLTAAPALHSLSIRERNKDADEILEFLFQKPLDLKRLILEHCYLGEDSTGLLASIVALYPDLEVLSLERCYPLTSDVYCLIPRLKKLSELHLSYGEVHNVKLLETHVCVREARSRTPIAHTYYVFRQEGNLLVLSHAG